MSSIDPASVFAEDITPRAGARFALTPDRDGSESYFVPRAHKTMSREDFERSVVRGPDELAARMTAWWSEHGDAELAPLASRLGELAAALREPVGAEESGEVSSLVYPMF